MPEATPGNASEARTSIDALVELLRQRGKSELNSLAAELGVDPKIVERWAKVLESGGMARISYEVGRMYLTPASVGKEELQSVKAKISARESVLQQSVAMQRAELDRFAQEVTSLSVQVASIENIYRQRMPEVQQMLGEINKALAQADADQKGIASIKGAMDAVYNDINVRVADLYAKIDTLAAAGNEASTRNSTERIGAALKEAGSAMGEIEELRKVRDRFIETLKKNTELQFRDMQRQIDSASNEIESRLKAETGQVRALSDSMRSQTGSAKALSDQISDFKRHADSAKNALAKARADFSDRHQKLSQSIYNSSKLADADTKAISDKIATLKSSFGDVSRLDDQIRELRAGVTEATMQVAGARLDLNEMQDALAALAAAPELSVEQRANVVDQLTEKDNSLKAKTVRAGKSVSDIGKKMQR